MKLGLAFICGNETNQIRAMLDSVSGIFDCISAVMTKNSVETESILKEYNCIINKVDEWNEDYSNWNFSEARQLSYDKCDADWIIYLDTDDILINGYKLRNVIENNKELDCIILPYDYEPNNIYSKERVIKKGRFKWQGLVHECLVPLGDNKAIIVNDIVIKHNMISNDRYDRNLTIIEREYIEAKTPRTVFYCAKDNLYANNIDKAVKYFKEVVTLPISVETYQSYIYLSQLIDIQYAYEAIKLYPEYAEPYFLIGNYYFRLNKYDECIKWLHEGFTKLPQAPHGMPFNRQNFDINPLTTLMGALFKKGENMDITKLSIGELKALAYDQLALIEQSQKNLQTINIEIQKKGNINNIESKKEEVA